MKAPEPASNVLESAPPGTNAHRSNGFDLLRLIAAITVIYGHAFIVAGSEDEPGVLGNKAATLAVKVFFLTSGFLITQSWMADPRILAFAMRRVLRIMPALICAVLLTTFVLGPIFSTLSPGAYLTNGSTWNYLWNIALYPMYSLPGVFDSNRYPVAVNGSLWTIPVEVFMYLTVPFLVWRNPKISSLGLAIVTVLMSVLGIYYVRMVGLNPPVVIYGNSVLTALEVSPYFLIGSLWAVLGLQRFSRPYLSVVLLVVAAAALYLYVLGEVILMVLLPFAVISVGMLHIPYVDKPLAKGDYSYGIYLYGFPVQQACEAASGNRMTPMQNFWISLPIVLILAVLSWFIIERKALSFKPKRAKKTA